MKTTLRKLTVTFGAFVVVAMMAATANAGCGDIAHKPILKRQAFRASEFAMPQLQLVSQDNDPITGMWEVTFTSSGATIDTGYSVWHADGTEIMNSGDRSPLTGDYCMGVWKNLGNNRYKLNHAGIGWDSTGTVQVGPANIVEEVELGTKGNAFSGTFTITQYDLNGNVLATVSGNITGKRIDVDTVINTF